jgi:hypothetical protein
LAREGILRLLFLRKNDVQQVRANQILNKIQLTYYSKDHYLTRGKILLFSEMAGCETIEEAYSPSFDDMDLNVRCAWCLEILGRAFEVVDPDMLRHTFPPVKKKSHVM